MVYSEAVGRQDLLIELPNDDVQVESQGWQMTKTLVLVDGENLLRRYEETVEHDRFMQAKGPGYVDHQPGRYVWSRLVLRGPQWGTVLRVSYFTTVQGSQEDMDALEQSLSELRYETASGAGGSLVPHVFQKSKNRARTKSVDINLTVEALRHTYNRTIDQLVILSGDGDYLPVVQEAMRQGIKVWGGAFRSGLNPKIRPSVDSFIELELFFFDAKS